ncbi:MAG TPA: IclR family transcriptional regulator [Streptosporangiaceae bacterium]|nr:IclR family transcriptional regulator [Streptosporangiaceae bacterium]
MKNRPPYAIASVDSALVLATLLQLEGSMRVTDAAERLGVAVSTAHRLLGMLVYRDFAEQLPDRRYGAGPLLRSGPVPQTPVARLREAAMPHLRRLVDAQGETANLMVLAGADVRFVATVECGHVLRVGDRTGRSLPAHRSSGGKAVLAGLPAEELGALLAGVDDNAVPRLQRELRTIRRRGFAVNDRETEDGLTAIGVAIPSRDGAPRAAICLAMPTARYALDLVPAWAAALTAAAEQVALDPGVT